MEITSVHVSKTDDKIIVNAELPGIPKDDIKIRFTDKGLEIATQSRRKSLNGEDYHSPNTSLYQIVPLPDALDEVAASARYKDGILTIDIPRLEIEGTRYNGFVEIE